VLSRTILGLLGKIPRPTPAMGVALVALLIAASGAAVASRFHELFRTGVSSPSGPTPPLRKFNDLPLKGAEETYV
jgi:hypothetical protein